MGCVCEGGTHILSWTWEMKKKWQRLSILYGFLGISNLLLVNIGFWFVSTFLRLHERKDVTWKMLLMLDTHTLCEQRQLIDLCIWFTMGMLSVCLMRLFHNESIWHICLSLWSYVKKCEDGNCAKWIILVKSAFCLEICEGSIFVTVFGLEVKLRHHARWEGYIQESRATYFSLGKNRKI